ncbi:MAG TPA: YHS domain-containing protein [Gemmatales bacterium]|nr:YHS domain-containing protein [Gemmatales bacterium]
MLICLALCGLFLPVDDAKSPKEALQGFQELIGGWRGTGEPGTGSAAEKAKGFWKETIRWSWKFKGDDAWLTFTAEKGKHFTAGELHSRGDNKFQLLLTSADGTKQTFEGKLSNNGRRLVADRVDKDRNEDARLTLSLVGDIRYQYTLETKPLDRKLYSKVFQIGATREGESLAKAAKSNAPECVVSGGLGTTKVTYKGETFYVCCSGCAEAFKDNPEKYIAEFKAKKK